MDVESNINALPPGYSMIERGNNMEILIRVEFEIAFASEKLLNLELLVMEIARQATDFEPITMEIESLPSETAENAFELDILYGILDAEVKELDSLISSLQTDLENVEHKVYEEESGGKIKAKLDGAMVSLKQMQNLIAEIRKESAKFEKTIDFFHGKAGAIEDDGCENGHMLSHTSMQTEDERRNVLHMLEQSIASELDLEKKLSDSRSIIEEMKLKLHHKEQEMYFLEESTETIYGRMFEAENASDLLLGSSKELTNKLSNIQFHVSASQCSEDDVKSKLEQSLTKQFPEFDLVKMQEDSEKAGAEAVHNLIHSYPELSSLRDKVKELEEQLRESGSQLQLAKVSGEACQEEKNMLHSDLSTLENTINNLKDDILRAESRAQNAEVRCMQLTQDNIELNGELSSLKSQGLDRASLLDRKLKESNTQLEHANASVDAIVEQQNMLRSTISDMEHMIEDLKGKVSKAEARAESAESKCTLLTDTNLELSEELSFMRGRVESLENSLHEVNHVKMSTVKDIGTRTKVITDLVTKLALERERLHHQISMLTKKNKTLSQKCKGSLKDGTQLSKKSTGKDIELHSTKLPEEIVLHSSPSQAKVEKHADLTDADEAMTITPEDNSSGEDMLGSVRTIEPSLMSWKYIAVAFTVLLAAALVYLVHQENDTVA